MKSFHLIGLAAFGLLFTVLPDHAMANAKPIEAEQGTSLNCGSVSRQSPTIMSYGWVASPDESIQVSWDFDSIGPSKVCCYEAVSL